MSILLTLLVVSMIVLMIIGRTSYVKQERLKRLTKQTNLIYRFENDGEPDRLQVVDDVRYCLKRATSHVNEFLSELRDVDDDDREWVLTHYMLASPKLRKDIRTAVVAQQNADRLQELRDERKRAEFNRTANDLGVTLEELTTAELAAKLDRKVREVEADYEIIETRGGSETRVVRSSYDDYRKKFEEELHNAIWKRPPPKRMEWLERSLPNPPRGTGGVTWQKR